MIELETPQQHEQPIPEPRIEETHTDGNLSHFEVGPLQEGYGVTLGNALRRVLLSSLEGGRGYPKLKPPFPAVSGLFGCPTVVNNVVTIAYLPYIFARGVAWWRGFGNEKSPGLMPYSVSGHVRRPGVYELPLGVPLRELIEQHAGGWDRPLKAVIPGGSSSKILRLPEDGDVKNVKYRKDVPQHRLYFHEYSPPDKIGYRVRRIMEWLNGPEAKKLKNPIRVAARVHYDLLRVFPFQTDSGKVARLFMNLLLMRSGNPPAIVHATERQRYYDALKGEPNIILKIAQESVENSLASV